MLTAVSGSLRQAMIDAQENDTITFADNVRGTILIETVLPRITTTLTIIGPGANLLTIDGANVPTAAGTYYSMLMINAPGHAVSISGLTFANDGLTADTVVAQFGTMRT